MAAAVLYRFSEVWKFAGEQPILRGITAEIPAGEVLTIIGPSGSGKSTLASLLNRLADPDRGQLEFLGRDLREWEVTELRRRVGLVFQNPTMLPGTVRDNLEYGPRLWGRSLGPEIAELLGRVGLSATFLDRRAADLSGGEKGRVALARTLANRPEVLLLDEITSALDPETAREVEELILALRRELGLTCVWVTHDLGQAERVGSLVWFLEEGLLAESGPAPAFFGSPSPRIRDFRAGGVGRKRS